jgi:hypothetical protein
MTPINRFTDASYGIVLALMVIFSNSMVDLLSSMLQSSALSTSTTEVKLLSFLAGAREPMAFTHFLQQAGLSGMIIQMYLVSPVTTSRQ